MTRPRMPKWIAMLAAVVWLMNLRYVVELIPRKPFCVRSLRTHSPFASEDPCVLP